MKTIAIIPVFNEERHIGRCLARLERFIDGIVALDDGSTDRSLEILSQHPRVLKIIRKPAQSKRNWNDARNHLELNRALVEFTPDWVIRIDADESFDEAMNVHLPKLVCAGPEIRAFAFRRHLFDEESRTCSTARLDIVRVYRYSPPSRFSARRLHARFEPVDVTGSQIRLTNIRLWHHTGYTERLREKRYQKFVQADPYRLYQDNYENLLRSPDFVNVEPPAEELLLSPWSGASHRSTYRLQRAGEWLRGAVEFTRARFRRPKRT